MTRVLVTGPTGLLGRHLVERLIDRRCELFLLVRRERLTDHAERLARFELRSRERGTPIHVVTGDVTSEGLGLGVDPKTLQHVFHVAGCYDLAADPDRLQAVNVRGTANLIAWLEKGQFAGVLHHVSSIAVAGDYEKRFGEDELDVRQSHPTPYHRTKFESERLVREASLARWRIYRPSAIVGHSQSGEMDRIDGPYYLFRAIHALRRALPPWVTLPGIDGGRVNMVPVDFVADAIDSIAFSEGLDRRGFHIVDPTPPSFRTTFNLIADAAEAPRMGRMRPASWLKFLPGATNVVGQLGSLRFLRAQYAEALGVPPNVADAHNRSVEYDTANVARALSGTHVACPPQEQYVEALWDYYVRHLDPRRHPERRDRAALSGKVMLVTGASSGIGEELARYAGKLGTRLVLVARRREELDRVASAIAADGGEAEVFVADLTHEEQCDAAVAHALSRYGAVDVLVNNAGRSIRRPLADSLDRFHDLERTMRLNYFAPARLIRGVLPSMRERRHGVIVNVLSAGTNFPSPRFGAYTASKAALAQLGDTLASEHLHDGIRVVNVYLPWVRTPMMDATGKYEDTRAMSAEKAARLIVEGIVERKQRVVNGEIRRRFALNVLRPEALTRVLNVLYRIYADDPDAHPELALDRAILKRFVKGRLM